MDAVREMRITLLDSALQDVGATDNKADDHAAGSASLNGCTEAVRKAKNSQKKQDNYTKFQMLYRQGNPATLFPEIQRQGEDLVAYWRNELQRGADEIAVDRYLAPRNVRESDLLKENQSKVTRSESAKRFKQQ